MKNVLEKEWKKSATSILYMAFRDEKDKIKTFLDMVWTRDFKNQECQIYNHYENEVINTKLSKVLDWIEVENPTLAESGVFFKQAAKQRNLQGELIIKRIQRRKEIKKLEFAATSEVERKFYQAAQKTVKLRLNSGYGIQSEPRSFAYSPHVPISITCAGRSQISISVVTTENFFSDFVKFMHMDELISYLQFFKEEMQGRKENGQLTNYKEVCSFLPTRNDVLYRLRSKFKREDDFDSELTMQLLSNFNQEMLTRLYYKCNLRIFLTNKTMRHMYQSLLDSPAIFLDPNDPPEEIKTDVHLFAELIKEFVHTDYIPFRYEDRNIMEMKDVVIVEDTDSTIIYYGEVLEFIENHVIKLDTEGKDTTELFEYDQKEFNILSYAHAVSLRAGQFHYLEKVNVPKENMHWINMKNEFYMPTVITTEGKKAYISNIARQEGKVYKKVKLDTKGVTFYKSTSTQKTTEFINNEILIDELLQPKDNTINLKRIMKKINRYRQTIEEDLKTGDMGYFSKALKIKNADAYNKDAMSISGYKATYVWNYLAPQEDQISLPAFVSLIKVKLFKKADLALLEDYPEIYEKLLYLFENDPAFKDKGIKAIAVPNGTEEMPEWILKIIDTETIVNNNMSLMSQIYGAIDYVPGILRHSGSEMKVYSSILRL